MNGGQLLFIGQQPSLETRIIIGPGKNGGSASQLWFRWKGDWVREEWCGKFPDGTPRPPWCDKMFFDLWNSEGPAAARDKARYDLSEIQTILELANA